jgi:ribosomal protein S18 acetylase RimI-like enzyme
MTAIRTLTPDDYAPVVSVVDDWWGGRPVQAVVHRLFFEHFNRTSFAVGEVGSPRAFLIGFVSQTQPQTAYIHLVGVHPAARALGLGRALYEHFFQAVRALGCTQVRCVTSPVNTGSIAFHSSLGFAILPGSGEQDGVPVMLNHAGEGQHRVFFQKAI